MVKLTLEVLVEGVAINNYSETYEVINGFKLVNASIIASAPEMKVNLDRYLDGEFKEKEDSVTITGTFRAKKDLVNFQEMVLNLTGKRKYIYGALLGASVEAIRLFWPMYKSEFS
jgi:hypothetical protein